MSDGLLGLSPRKANSGQNQTVHLLVDELKNDGVIDKAMFAFDLRSQADLTAFSKVTFGGYDPEIALDRARPYRDFDDFGEPIVHWMEQDSQQHWQTRMFAVQAVFEDGVTISLPLSVKHVIYDTGTSISFLPKLEFEAILSAINAD